MMKADLIAQTVDLLTHPLFWIVLLTLRGRLTLFILIKHSESTCSLPCKCKCAYITMLLGLKL